MFEHLEKGKPLKVQGERAHHLNGTLCPKGRIILEHSDHHYWVNYALKRAEYPTPFDKGTKVRSKVTIGVPDLYQI